MSYLIVRNWERYQHYKNRRPIWIKFYVELLDDMELRKLPITTRLLWDQLLLLAAKSDNRILNDSEEIARSTRIPHEATANGIQELLEGRWLRQVRSKRHASKMLANRYQVATPEAETEKEQKQNRSKTTPRTTPDMNGLPISQQLHTLHLLNWIGDHSDNGTPTVITNLVNRTTEAQLIHVIESSKTAKARNRAKWAVGALQSELDERTPT